MKNDRCYRGYYYDAETGLYYLQSRYYDAKVGRFINADRMIDQNSWQVGHNIFTYVANRPLLFSDPKGESIELKGSTKQTYELFVALQQLTNNVLKMSGNKVIRSRASTGSKRAGTALIAWLIGSKYTCTIRKEANTVSRCSTPYAGAGSVLVYINCNEKLYSYKPLYIVLAHELIHAYHGMSGTVNRQKGFIRYTVYRSVFYATPEELITIGISTIYTPTRYLWVSENIIRKEHGLPMRYYH